MSARRNSSVVTYSMCHKHSRLQSSDGLGDGGDLTDFPQSPRPPNQDDAMQMEQTITDNIYLIFCVE